MILRKIGLGKTRLSSIAFSIATPFGLVLAYLMLQRYGIIGVAWAQGITATVTLVLLIALAAYALRDGRSLRPATNTETESIQ